MTTINDYVKIYQNDKKGILLDVRERDEVAIGKILDSINIPLGEINDTTFDKSKTIYVYCRSGRRSAIAAAILKKRGYNTIDIGGIIDYNEE